MRSVCALGEVSPGWPFASPCFDSAFNPFGILVPGGTFNRDNDPSFPATVDDFKLDMYEVTVGRFRAFVNAGGATQANPPPPGAGAHPLIVGTGWDPDWNMYYLPSDRAALEAGLLCSREYRTQTWTGSAGANENYPINCVDWYQAFAFCAWDGGRLSTEVEWNYAAAGGSEQREYPWGDSTPNTSLAVFECGIDGFYGCTFADILPVGSIAAGRGRLGTL
jgi:sulfatase modifying factor 1